MKSHKYTEQQIDFLRVGYRFWSLEVLVDKFNSHFCTSLSVSSIRGATRNHRLKSGRTGRFNQGSRPWNIGTAGSGVCKPNRGTFVKGNIPANIRPMGSERIDSKDGYVLVKVDEENPYTGCATRFKPKHVLVWEKHNGPVPDGCCIRFRDGDKTNCVVENLICVTRAEHMHLTRLGHQEAMQELRPSVEALAKLEVKMFERRRRTSQVSEKGGKNGQHNA